MKKKTLGYLYRNISMFGFNHWDVFFKSPNVFPDFSKGQKDKRTKGQKDSMWLLLILLSTRFWRILLIYNLLNGFSRCVSLRGWNCVLRNSESLHWSWDYLKTLVRNDKWCQDYLVHRPKETAWISATAYVRNDIEWWEVGHHRFRLHCFRLQCWSDLINREDYCTNCREIKESFYRIPLPTNRLRRWHRHF